MSPSPYPSQKSTLLHPAYPGTIWSLRPRLQGHCTVALTRPGGPIKIGYSVHGTGPTKLVFLIGLAGTQASWQRQTHHFAHLHGTKYTVLTLDNRGIGASSAPFRRYTTTEMAHDVLELLEFLSWTAPRSVHLVGMSLGGMIAQEAALLSPSRFATLSLVSTAGEVANTGGLSEGVARLGMLIPKSLEATILDTANKLFPESWMLAPDDCVLPDPEHDADVDPPPANVGEDGEGIGEGDKYLRFENNFQRFQAQELRKRLSPTFSTTGFLMQLLAAGWHRKTPKQLAEMADKVGRERILVYHGLDDKMISPVLGRRLAEAIKPGKAVFEKGLGHATPLQKTAWFNDMLAAHFEDGERINREGVVG